MYKCTTTTGVHYYGKARQGKAEQSGQGRVPSADTGPQAGCMCMCILGGGDALMGCCYNGR